jgi:protease IV
MLQSACRLRQPAKQFNRAEAVVSKCRIRVNSNGETPTGSADQWRGLRNMLWMSELSGGPESWGDSLDIERPHGPKGRKGLPRQRPPAPAGTAPWAMLVHGIFMLDGRLGRFYTQSFVPQPHKEPYMLLRCLIVVLLSCGISLGSPTTRPTTQPADPARAEAEAPTTQPIVADHTEDNTAEADTAAVAAATEADPAADPTATEASAQAPTIADPPTTQPSVDAGQQAGSGTPELQAGRFPTPAELLERMKKMQEQHESLLKVAYFDLSERIVEKPADFSLFGESGGETLQALLERLYQARDDAGVRATLLTIRDTDLNLAQAQEIRNALVEIRRAGKQTFVYADSYDTVSYTVASGATNVCLLEGGQIMMPGIGVEAMFAKGLLDKVGVVADYVQIGEYKGADEQFTRTGPTDELRGELNKLIDALYEQIVDGISLNRNIPREQVRQIIDDAIITAPAARQRGLIDHLVDMDGLRDLIAEELGDEINLVHDYGRPERPELDFSNPFALFASIAHRPEPSGKPMVALVHVEGMIVDGKGGDGLFGGGAGSEDIRTALRIASRDDEVKAVVLRINSPGGSPLASEVMWQSARRVAEDKPVIVSIGSMAASGGYYVASAGDHIFADPTAVVGSIGVVGGKFVLKDLYEKLGLSTEAFHRGRNADLFSSSQPFSDRQRRMVTNWMRQTYDTFTDRIMATRSGKIRDIDQVARGRIFVARQAMEMGMVDELGGLQEALSYAAGKAGLERGEFEVRLLPAPRSLADLFMGGPDAAMPFQPQVQVSADSVLRALPAPARRAVMQQVMLMQMLEERPVLLVTPYVITVR